ncbi:MerR family transcriptional regulator [Streptomyces chartreusis]|uniref:MerR family transcriptional regulator n=1 Tax=Streptomyces chartreusis TaxID=1969 RepID=UPI0038018DEC
MRWTRRGIRHEPLYTATEAADFATTWRPLVSAGAAAVTPAIRQWASRGHLTPSKASTTIAAPSTPAPASPTPSKRACAPRLVGIGTD